MKFTIIAFFLLVGLTTFARLGETDVEIAKRYGPVQKRTTESTNEWNGFYIFKDYHVFVTYSNNVSVCETISPAPKRTMSAEEVSALMKSVGGTGEWQKDKSRFDPTTDYWVHTKTRSRAVLMRTVGEAPALMIMTAAYDAKTTSDYKRKEKSKASGF